MQESTGASSAADNVFGILELLENILLETNIKDLLVNAQRVSKTWYTVIQQSTRLQQGLFMKPLPGKPLEIYRDGGWAGHKETWKKDSSDSHEEVLVRNPFIPLISKVCNDNIKGEAIPKRFRRADASWKRMLATQPPTWLSVKLATAPRNGLLQDAVPNINRLDGRAGWNIDYVTIAYHRQFVDAVRASDVHQEYGCLEERSPEDERAQYW